MPRPAAAAGPRHGWIWSALPAGCRTARVEGDDELAALLAGAGLSEAAPGAAPQVVVLQAPAPGDVARHAQALREGDLLAVVWPTAGADGGRLRRLVGRAAPGAGRAARAAQAEASGAGLVTWRLDTGERGRRHTLEPGEGAIGPGRHPILLASRGAAVRTVLDAALAAASEGREEPLVPAVTRVLASGTVLVELRDGLLLRVAGGPAARLLQHASAAQAALASADPAVASRLVPPLAAGEVPPAVWTLEARAAGVHPPGLTPEIVRDAQAFLAALFAAPDADVAAAVPLSEEAALLAAHVRDPARLERIGARLEEQLAAVPRGWQHGDFWASNLLVVDGRLASVLDWDSAARRALPLLDLLHLIGHGDRDKRRLSHGTRCAERLWPLARSGGDERIREYCAATGTPDDPATLEALAVAYWLVRAARDVRTFADRTQRPAWMEANVHGPLDALREAGW